MIIEKGIGKGLDTETMVHLVDRLCQVSGNHAPSRRTQIEAILEGHLQKAKFAPGEGVPVVLRLMEMGNVRIRSIRGLAAQWGVPEAAVAEGVRIKTERIARDVQFGPARLPELLMTRMHNVGTADEPRRVITIPDPAAWILM